MKSYYLTNRFRYMYIGLLISLTLITIGILTCISRQIPCIQFYFIALGVISIPIAIYKFQNEHIIISQNGVEYHSPWLIFETQWEYIEKISHYWHNGIRHESLIVDNSKVLIKKWNILDRGPSTPLDRFPYKTIIPLSCFSENWRESELGQQIKQYAPHLFAK